MWPQCTSCIVLISNNETRFMPLANLLNSDQRILNTQWYCNPNMCTNVAQSLGGTSLKMTIHSKWYKILPEVSLDCSKMEGNTELLVVIKRAILNPYLTRGEVTWVRGVWASVVKWSKVTQTTKSVILRGVKSHFFLFLHWIICKLRLLFWCYWMQWGYIGSLQVGKLDSIHPPSKDNASW